MRVGKFDQDVAKRITVDKLAINQTFALKQENLIGIKKRGTASPDKTEASCATIFDGS